MNKPSITLHALWRIANEWVPYTRAWGHLLMHWYSWGPAHEIGHALIEDPAHRATPGWGLSCEIGFCKHDDERCDVHEAAAMMISQTLVTATGHLHLANDEIESTIDYDHISQQSFNASKALLRIQGLWPIPTTKEAIVSRLKARLGSRVPIAKRRKRSLGTRTCKL
jgi:hypothetical protein